ncbi:MAG: hypothetical protein GXY06_01410 [Clostridiaceae bacterium]|nr:hypothetical protein [Clostridiaceae bacterium]
MTITSELTEQLTAQTGLNLIDSSHLAGRCNGYFTKAEIQSHLSRLSLSIFAFGLDRELIEQMEEYLNRQEHPSSHAIVVDDTQITIYLPIIHNTVPGFQNVLLRVTTFLMDRGVTADIIETTSASTSDWAQKSDMISGNHQPRYFLGLFGSILGAIPGALLWFIFSMISNYEYLARFPSRTARLSPWFVFSVIITFGSYWGFLLLSDATRKASFFMSFPITLSAIFVSNHISYAFIIYAATSDLHYFEAVFFIKNYLDRYDLSTYYWISFVIGVVLALVCNIFLLHFRERSWFK